VELWVGSVGGLLAWLADHEARGGSRPMDLEGRGNRIYLMEWNWIAEGMRCELRRRNAGAAANQSCAFTALDRCRRRGALSYHAAPSLLVIPSLVLFARVSSIHPPAPSTG
jgi:hypothetical protein